MVESMEQTALLAAFEGPGHGVAEDVLRARAGLENGEFASALAVLADAGLLRAEDEGRWALVRWPDWLCQPVFAAALTPGGLCRRAVFLDEVGSTNTYARGLLDGPEADGTAVLAARQTGGRGRRGRQWLSEAGSGLYLSFLFQSALPLEELQRLTLAVGVAVCRAVGRCLPAGVAPTIKWPNDVLLGGRKLCGILCESATDSAGRRHVIVGVGVNTRTPTGGFGELESIATSLEAMGAEVPPRASLAAWILNELYDLMARWQAEGFGVVAAAYRPYLPPAGAAVTVLESAGPAEGQLVGLADDGALVVRLADGTLRSIVSGEVSVKPKEGSHVSG